MHEQAIVPIEPTLHRCWQMSTAVAVNRRNASIVRTAHGAVRAELIR